MRYTYTSDGCFRCRGEVAPVDPFAPHAQTLLYRQMCESCQTDVRSSYGFTPESLRHRYMIPVFLTTEREMGYGSEFEAEIRRGLYDFMSRYWLSFVPQIGGSRLADDMPPEDLIVDAEPYCGQDDEPF